MSTRSGETTAGAATRREPEGAPPVLSALRPVLGRFARARPEILRLEVFGSVARGDAGTDSDVDVLVTFSRDWKKTVIHSPWGGEYFECLEALEGELTGLLHWRVHVLDRDNIREMPGQTALACAVARDGQLVYAVDPATG